MKKKKKTGKRNVKVGTMKIGRPMIATFAKRQATKSTVLPIRLSPEELKAIDQAAKVFKLDNRTAVVRHCINRTFAASGIKATPAIPPRRGMIKR